jgi:DNA mismatch endonuclease (patch repair protein)
MTDALSKQQRSANMRAVKSRDTGPEIAIRKIVHRLGYRYRLHVRSLPGRPDLVFPSRRKIIFVHGCFWHRHSGCKRATLPKTRQQFWRNKLASNVARDRRAGHELKRLDWAILTVWQCELKKPDRLTKRLNDFLS